MARVELTEKPCPECGTPLELHIEQRKADPSDPMRTARVVRTLRCTVCPYAQEDRPPAR